MNWLKPQQEEQDQKNKGQFTEVAKSIEQIAKTFGETQQELQEFKTKYSTLENDFKALKVKLSQEPHPDTPPAPENTGNFSEQIDC